MHRILPYLLAITLFFTSHSILRGVDISSNSIGSSRKITFAKNNAVNDYLPQSQNTSYSSDAPESKEETEIHSLAAFIKEQNRYITHLRPVSQSTKCNYLTMPDKLYKILTMKKVLITFWYLILANNISNAQEQKTISSDSLLKMFKVMKPFEVFERVQFTWFDFKSCYNNTLLKPYLMKWLDRDKYFQYEIDRERATITNSPKLIKEEIQYMLNKQGRKNVLDSFLNNVALYSQYRDSTIDADVKRFFEHHINGIGNCETYVHEVGHNLA